MSQHDGADALREEDGSADTQHSAGRKKRSELKAKERIQMRGFPH